MIIEGAFVRHKYPRNRVGLGLLATFGVAYLIWLVCDLFGHKSYQWLQLQSAQGRWGIPYEKVGMLVVFCSWQTKECCQFKWYLLDVNKACITLRLVFWRGWIQIFQQASLFVWRSPKVTVNQLICLSVEWVSWLIGWWSASWSAITSQSLL